jgi:hypothetical protein
LTPKVGFLAPPSAFGTTAVLGGELLIYMNPRSRAFAAVLEATYAGPSLRGQRQDATLESGRFDYALDADTVALSALVHYTHRRGLPPGLSLHGAIGPRVAGVFASETVGYGGTDPTTRGGSESATGFGVAVLSGASYRIGPGDVMAELRFAYAPVRMRLTGDVGLGGFGLAVGYRFYLL